MRTITLLRVLAGLACGYVLVATIGVLALPMTPFSGWLVGWEPFFKVGLNTGIVTLLVYSFVGAFVHGVKRVVGYLVIGIGVAAALIIGQDLNWPGNAILIALGGLELAGAAGGLMLAIRWKRYQSAFT